VIIFHDHGSRYVGKIYNDDWMRERGFLEDELKVRDLISKKSSKQFFSVKPDDTVRSAFKMMKDRDISQMPVVDVHGEMVGSITENAVLTYLLENPMQHTEHKVSEIMSAPFPTVQDDLPCRQLNRYISKKIPAVVAKDRTGTLHILTKYDIIQAV
jgi:cystathionine beta-synthase